MKRLVSASLLVLASFIASAGSNDYSNPTIGFRVTKPAAWHFLTTHENLASLGRTKLQDEQLQEAMAKYATAPLLIMAKYPEPYADVNPSIKVTIKPLGQLEGEDAKAIANLVLPGMQNALKSFALVQAPTDVTVSGLAGAYLRITYSLENPEGGSFPTSSELWIVPRGDYFFLIGAGTRVDEKTGTRQEIQRIVQSMRIDR